MSYLLPLLQRMIEKKQQQNNHASNNTKRGNGSPQILILAPTAELADQIKVVCDKTTSSLEKNVPSSSSSPSIGSIFTRVITATGSHSTNIRDQIRMLSNQKVDVLISTPGRIATILRTKNTHPR